MFIPPVGGSSISAEVTADENELRTSEPFSGRSSITSAREHAPCFDPTIPKAPKTSDGGSALDTVYQELLVYKGFSDDGLSDLSDEERIALVQKLRYLGNNMFGDFDKLSVYEDFYYPMADRLERLGFLKN